jgi:nitrite reductase/ring-hydroxylating ferredoxin subunit
MAMPGSESVSSSLITRSSLAFDDIVGVDALIDGENESIMIHFDGDTIRAWLNVCPHAGRRMDYAPGRFLRDGLHLVCAAHGASFELRHGQCVAGPCRGAHLREVVVSEAEGGVLVFGPLKTSG